ncbi:MAG: prolyl oligopeptidase family serine peptidase [Saprospiraceae bacterium]
MPFTINDSRLWRMHAVALSDNGEWYTTHYHLLDKAESKKDTALEKLVEQTSSEFYDENNQTDVLYIHNVKEGIKYKIPDGNNPVFSFASDWIAYKIKPESDAKAGSKEKKDTTYIELKHLESGFTVRYESEANFSFLEDKNYFITNDKNSLVIYDLEQRREHFIGNLGEYLVDKKSPYIAYTITTEDKRGNGIYLYDPVERTTKALTTGNFMFSNLSWNSGKDALAAYKFNKKEKEIDYDNISIVVLSNIGSGQLETLEYPVQEMEAMPEDMALAANIGKSSEGITWSKDGDRLFLKLKKQEKEEDKKAKKEAKEEEATVQIWHWKDKKLLSQRIMEEGRKKDETFDAVFFRTANKIMPLTGEAIQNLLFSEGTDHWAIGTDNREYISDWDVNTHDLYRINLKTGEKKLIEKKFRSRYGSPVELSPDGTKAILWDEEHYWCYDFAKDAKHNISEGVGVSFIDKEYDRFGYIPNYGFVGWVKDRNAVIINHKYDLWLLPLDDNAEAQNLTAAVTQKDDLRFRFEDTSFEDEAEIEDRYIDLSKARFLNVFNKKTKYAGVYKLEDNQLTELMYQPVRFLNMGSGYTLLKAKEADVVMYRLGDYQNSFETYLSNPDLSNPQQITNTNPQQEKYSWGRRILIDYTNDDGVPLQGILSIPESYREGQKLPMIVYSYEKLSDIMYHYAIPHVRGSTAPERLYVSDGYLYLMPDIHFNIGTPHSDMHECIDAAIEKVIELGYVDEERIGYNGFSFGGHCGMYMSTQKNRFAAISAGAGVSNLVQGFNIDIVSNGSNEQDYYMTGQGRLSTDPTSNTQMYISESPVFNAQTMNTPLLLYHGTDDKVVQWEHSYGFYSILRYLKKPVVFLSYLGEGHGLRKESNRLDFQIRLKEFFDHYLKGAEAKAWMTEETPYVPKENDKEKSRTVPKWK